MQSPRVSGRQLEKITDDQELNRLIVWLAAKRERRLKVHMLTVFRIHKFYGKKEGKDLFST